MTHIHYKFSSKLSYDTVLFDGPHITLSDLKRQIMGREKLRAGDCDLQITNAQTKEEYTDDEGLIPKGSSVIVRRIPIIGVKSGSSSKTLKIDRSDQLHHAFGAGRAMDDQNSSRALSFFSKMQMANLVDADVSEEDKIKVMMNQSNYDSINLNTKLGTVLPGNYICYRCGNTGHHIRNCPTSGQDKSFEAPLRIKKSTGIPRSFMVEVDDPSIKGAMLTNCGRYAIPAIDAEAYAIGKKEKPPFIPEERPKSEEDDDPIPSELVCLICHDLLADAVVIPCCGNSYCDDCIRTALLDSEDHVCPTCGQLDVSPDTLIANKFLRQAVNNFKKERDHTKSLKQRPGTSQSQNLTPTTNPVPTLPVLTMQSQLPKPQQPPFNQQDAFQNHPKDANTLALSHVSGVPPEATGPASAHSTTSTSLQPVQSHLEISDLKTEGKTHDDSAAAPPSAPVPNKDPSPAPSQLIPLVDHTVVAEQPQTVGVNQTHSSVPTPRHSGSSASWASFSSSSGYSAGSWNESNTSQLMPSSSSSSTSSYSAAPPPLFASPVFHTFLPAHQSHCGYPPRYPPATPVWTLPTPQGAIPSLCSPGSSTSIPGLIPKEWYKYPRKKSPHRGSSYRRSSSHSKSSKSKSSRSYSHSSSHSGSRSRSRSQGRSRHHSLYSRRRDLHTRSRPSSSYTYGYKRSRSPTPSSSSSPRVGSHSRSKSPSIRHHSKKTASSGSSSRRRGERSGREAGGSRGSSSRNLRDHHRTSQTSSMELDREQYLQWSKEYKEWCEKYYSSYQAHQLPVPLLSLPAPPCPHWEDTEGSRKYSHDNFDSRCRPQGRSTAVTDSRSPSSGSSSDSRSPPSQSSSDSRSPPSHSSSDSCSTPSQSSSDSRSSLSHTDRDGRRCPSSQSSSVVGSTPTEDGPQARAYPERVAEENLSLTLAKNSKDVNLQEQSTDSKQLVEKDLDDSSPVRHEQKRKLKEKKEEESSSPGAADSTYDSSKHKRRHNTGPNVCKDNTSIQDKATASDSLESVQPLLKQDKPLEKEEKNLESIKGLRGSKDSEQDVEGQCKVKPSKEPDGMETDAEAPDSTSEKTGKRKVEDLERNEAESSLSVEPESSKCLQSKTAEDLKSEESDSPKPFERKKQKTEPKREKIARPLTERDIWEGGIKVKPQKKISINININLDGKRKEEKTDKQASSYLENITGKSQENTDLREEMANKSKTDVGVNEKKESSKVQDILFEEKIKPDEGKARQMWDKATFRDDRGEMWKKIAGEEDVGEIKDEEEDSDLWHCALRGVEEVEGGVTKGDEEAGRARDERGEQEMGEFGPTSLKEEAEREDISQEDGGEPCTEEGEDEAGSNRPNTSSTSRVGSLGSEESQDTWTVVKTLEEYTTDKQDVVVHIEVPRSKWEKEDNEDEQDEGKIRVRTDTAAVALPHRRESEGDNEQQRQRSMAIERDRDRLTARGRDRERSSTLSSHRSVAPSSGRDKSGSAACTDRDKETRTVRERDRERGRERHKESKRSKERTREEKRGRDRGRERERSSDASMQKRDRLSSSHSYSSSSHSYSSSSHSYSSSSHSYSSSSHSYSSSSHSYSSSSHSHSSSTLKDTERRDWQRGGNQRSNWSSSCPSGKVSRVPNRGGSATSRAADPPDQNAGKTKKDALPDLKCKDKDKPQYYCHPAGNHRQQDRPSGTHQSPPSLSHSHAKDRELPSCESSKRSPTWGSVHSNSRNEAKVEKGECKPNKVDKVVKEAKEERNHQETVVKREGGSRWEDEVDKLHGGTKWEGWRELEERERPRTYSSSSSSSISSASQENSKDKTKERRKKQKKAKKEKRCAAPELPEERELKKHKKKSKRSKDGVEESEGEGDESRKAGADHTMQ